MTTRVYIAATAWTVLLVGPLASQQPPSYAKQIKPFFARYCVECHNGEESNGSLNLETFKTLQEGGQNGVVFVAGKPDESKLVLQVEGKAKPFMPPKKAKQPKREEIALLRTWVSAGAKDDTASIATAIPFIKPRLPLTAPVSALAYQPDGKLLAAGGQGEVSLIDLATGSLTGKLTGKFAKVTALGFSNDGRHFALATGEAGTSGVVRIHSNPVSAASPPVHAMDPNPLHVIAAHRDLIYDLAFSPDGKHLASAGYDRLIKLWDITSGKEVRTLKDHSDTIYSLAFSPDGKLLASAAADRAVKVWDVAGGKRLYTLSDNTDWVYAVAWSPDGKRLAAGGVDKSIRVWEVSAAEGKLVQSVFAHEGPIIKLAYSADGQTLYSASEDRTVKAWDTARLTERKVYAKQPEAIQSLDIRAGQIAIGRYDGALVLLDDQSGQVQSQSLPEKPKPPEVSKLSPSAGRRGQTIRVTIEGKHLDASAQIVATHPGITAKLIHEAKSPTSLSADITIAKDTPAGMYQLSLKTAAGQSAAQPFAVDWFEPTQKNGGGSSPSTAQPIALPTTVVGSFARAGAVDYFHFEAKQGQQIGVQVVATKFDPVLLLTDEHGNLLAESANSSLGYTCAKAGGYAIGVRDREYRGEPSMTYRLNIGDIPVVTAIFPLGLQRGTEQDIQVNGVNLGGVMTVRLKAGDAAVGTKLPVAVATPNGLALGGPTVVIGEFAEIARSTDRVLTVPGTANGRIHGPGVTETWRFQAKKGERLIIETNARRLGSPLDSVIEILDAKGNPVPRATLRAVAKTYVTFRDHDSAGSGIRIETWNELAINDYLLVGDELLRIFELPKNPDDDCQFYSVKGQRIGWLDTTPTHHPMGAPMYKVTIHPPGTAFPPNGFPVVTLFYRNDDGGPGYGKDSRLFFDAPADGEYQARVGDARGLGGPTFAYRLTVRPPRPSYNVSFSPTSPAVWKGNAVPIAVTADRIDGYDGPISVRLENLPHGLSAPVTTIPAGEISTAFALYAEPNATISEKTPALKLMAKATIDGKEVAREANGGVPKVVEPGDLLTTTEQSEVTVRPSQETRVTVKIQRQNMHKGRVPVEVRGLPHGVRVLDIGLNGILITEQESSRTFVIYAEPWVQPMEHPFVVLARSERKGSEHAAKSVLLKVAK
jgi:WD40 repeat protein